jgi:hypothetical protein
MFKWLLEKFWALFNTTKKSGVKTLPPVVFSKLVKMGAPPQVATMGKDTLYVVAPKGVLKWVMLRCPCGCDEPITLSLQQVHQQRWQLEVTKDQRGSIYPSVWRTTGCRSHFWLKDGRVFWA